MDFPVKLNNVQIGEVLVAVNGFELDSIVASDFHQSFNKQLSDKMNLWLVGQGAQSVTAAQFKAHGIQLALKAQDLVIEMKLEESAMATDKLTYNQKKNAVFPNQEASWALLNNFNLNHRRSNNNQSHDSQFEWLMDGNIGGGDGVNLQGSMFWQNTTGEGISADSQAYRGDFKLFYDQPEKPLRYIFGDTQSRSVGHLSSHQVGGLSINKAWSQLQPQRNLSPGNSQVFVLERNASVEIYVNDFMISRIRLRPGRYNVNDLPLTSGSNKIHLIATFNNGETEQFNFTTHYNAQLLASGLSDYAVAIGYPSTIDSRVYHYGDDLLLSGMMEYGVTDKLTLGVNGVTHNQGHAGGVTATMGSPWGNVSLRYSLSKGPVSKGNDQLGQIFSIETEHSVFGQSNFGSPNLRLGYERKDNFVASPWLTQTLNSQNLNSNNDTERLFFDYSYYVSDSIDFNAYGSFILNAAKQRTKEFTAQFNWRQQGLNISTGYRYGVLDDVVETADNQYFINLRWSFYNRQNNTRNRARYTSRTKVATISHTKVNNNNLNDYGYQLQAERGSDYRREQLRSSFTSRLFRTDFSADNFTRDAQHARSNTSINFSTSVGIADGHVGIGTNVTSPFAVISKHRTLNGVDVLLNLNRNQQAQTATGDNIGALINLGSGYTHAQFSVDVPDAPFGYDWGPGTYRLAGGASTGHYFQVGSDLSYTILGVLVDGQGEQISLQRGKVVDASGEYSKSFFTNRAGRFVIEGIGAGEFTVHLNGSLGYFTIAESEQRFVKLGKIMLIEAPEKDATKEAQNR
ncbi:MAG: outer membrane usher protein [Phenylobacterium sp.]|jgi:outer membrane usher protein